MSTTSLKLPDDVKRSALAAAKRQGLSPHAFMVEAIRAAAIAAEKRAEFISDALASKKQTLETGKGYRAEEVHEYMRTRAQGKGGRKPRLKSWRG